MKFPSKQQLKKVITDTLKNISESNLLLIASSLAFTTTLSIIPLLAVSFSIFKTFGGLMALSNTLEPFILQNLAEGTSQEVLNKIRVFISNTNAGAIGISGFLILLLTSISLLSNIDKAIHLIWKIKIKRSFFHRISVYWLFISLGPLLVAFLIGFLSSTEFTNILSSSKEVVFNLIAFLFFFVIYKWIPNTKVNLIAAFISTVFTSSFWLIAKSSYGYYLKNFVSYNQVYGSLAAIPIMLLWIYILWVIFLSGAAICAAIQKRIDLK